MWMKLVAFGAIPAFCIAMYSSYVGEMEHMAHHERPEFVPYSYMYVRTKAFPWKTESVH